MTIYVSFHIYHFSFEHASACQNMSCPCSRREYGAKYTSSCDYREVKNHTPDFYMLWSSEKCLHNSNKDVMLKSASQRWENMVISELVRLYPSPHVTSNMR
uniref:Uncharacterized protein n=1 Tax=Oryza brachyantha TaxID=4533 RepID=J3N144_ORYBR